METLDSSFVIRHSSFVNYSGWFAVFLAHRLLSFFLKPPLMICHARARRDTFLGRNHSLGNPVANLLAGILQVPVLIPRALTCDDKPSKGIQTARNQAMEPLATGVVDSLNPFQIDPQFDLGRNLVHILPARARCSHGAHLQGVSGHENSIFHEDRIRHD